MWVVERDAPEVLIGRSIDEGVRATTGLGERGDVSEVAEREGALRELWRHNGYHQGQATPPWEETASKGVTFSRLG